MENVTSETTQHTNIADSEELVVKTLTLLFLFISAFFNGSCIVLLRMCENIRENRFYSLTMYHSICDVLTCISAAFAVCLSLTKTGGVFCILNFGLLSGTILCSLYQTLLISLYQMMLLFEINHSFQEKLFKMPLIILTYGLLVVWSGVVYFIFGETAVRDCSLVESTTDKALIYMIDLPAVLLTVLILTFYVVIICKTAQRYKQVQPLNNNTTKRLKQYGVTLGWVITVSLVSILPSSIYSISCLSDNVIMRQDIRRYTNAMYTLKVVCDPLLFVFRIRKFRVYICKKCCYTPNPNAVVPLENVEQGYVNL